MIIEIEKNVETEIKILREISSFMSKAESMPEQDRRLLLGAVGSLRNALKIVNKTIPAMLKDTTIAQQLPGSSSKRKFEFEKIRYGGIGSNIEVVLDSKNKARFLKELSISEKFIKKLKKLGVEKEERVHEFKKSRGYLKMANKFFLRRASIMVKNGKFKTLISELRKGNVEILYNSYIAMMFFSVLLAFFLSIFLLSALLFFEVSLTWPFFSTYEGSVGARILRLFWIPLVLPVLVYALIYYYPSTEKKTTGKKINQELPFAVIHMSAISGSGIEPSEIFKIIGLSNEYPNLRKEVRKVLNQINLYGYDLVTALNNAAKTSPSDKLSELFSGLSTTITSGANLSEFFEKRAESLLLEYRLEREKYTQLVETFLDIYISIVIAAPMIFLLLLIMMAISGIGVGFTSAQLSLIAVFGIALLNVAFIVFLQLKQPSY